MVNREAILTNSFSYYYNYTIYKGGIDKFFGWAKQTAHIYRKKFISPS